MEHNPEILFIMNLLTNLLTTLFFFTAVETIYLFVFTMAGRFGRLQAPPVSSNPVAKRMAVLIPAYKEDAVIVDTAEQALKQDYPGNAYDVIVIADSLRRDTLDKLAKLPITVVEVSFDVSTKSKALNATLKKLNANYDVAVILDADNVMATDFLTHINAAFNGGWKAVQGHRVAKNTNTSVAILDAVSEEINTYILRRGHRALGLSGSLMGSGMAFDYTLFKQYMGQIDTTGGFDKELEMRLIHDHYRIDYIDDALCYDEKVQSGAVFERQRARWIAAQLKYLRRNLPSGIIQLLKGNLDYFDKVFQTMFLPRVILLGFLTIGTAAALLLRAPNLLMLAGGQLIVLLLSFYVATPKDLKSLITWQEIKQVPGLFFRFLRSITRLGEAGKKFINTPHTTTSTAINEG
ncbi:Glycosyltransferase, catalytic subunit of cellulose synthase and poly-beta-1,6-N-acetylglucosamine synthase [Spirosoma fluviale]|uniref:Glycosyltransferase, catalytic subunit of cellulose synthase and poly-beta-1,6-N-acetylglucosamine synthase n=2 Tax=Spirosoma fluviale TaxID=1597977 RepID=A0A286GCC6_9BACT|nr:Glycosyltransferase, catalytic subunit of cellulose synthase and poly-beta-1,6-N-acetylglucosamine synthase [Spirosoma fluviale]